jgi:hypothetical protein
MSDRINTITVLLEKDTRLDDCDAILTAIRMTKGVLKATPNVADARDWMAEERARNEFRKKLWDALEGTK